MKPQDDASFSFDITDPCIESLATAIGPAMLTDFMRIIAKADVAIATQKMQKPRAAQTYIMLDEQTGCYKIGKSIKPAFREKTLQAQRPTIVLVASCAADIEATLHALLAEYRIRGEWFRLDAARVADIIKQYNFTTLSA